LAFVNFALHLSTLRCVFEVLVVAAGRGLYMKSFVEAGKQYMAS
jgi:hypothetical protein